MTDYNANRKIKQDRIYKTLGKMSLWRVLLGLALLVFILFFTGTVSDAVARQGNFRLAQQLLIWPGWMEKNRPEDQAYIAAGVLYQEGSYEEACEGFRTIEGHAQAELMLNRSLLRLAETSLAEGDAERAAASAAAIDASALTSEEAERLSALLAALPGQ